MHLDDIAVHLLCFLQHQLWAVSRGAGQQDSRSARLWPCKSFPELVGHTCEVLRDTGGKTGSLVARSSSLLSSDGIMCPRTNHPVRLRATSAKCALFRTLVCTRQRACLEHRQRREQPFTGRTRTGAACLHASNLGQKQRHCHVSSPFGVSLQEQRLTSARGGHEFPFTPLLQPYHAINAAPVEARCYDSRFWIDQHPLSPFTGGSAHSQFASSKGGIRPRKAKLPAAEKSSGFSCRPHAQGAQSAQLLSGTSRRRSISTYNNTHTLDGIIPVIKPKGPTSGDICHQIAKLRRQHCEQILKKSLRPVSVSGVREDGAMEGTNWKHGNADGSAAKQRTGVGHGGTLDPAASGVLVLGVGKGTKLLHRFLTGSKGYRAVVKLGVSTDTLDASGVTTDTCDWSHVSINLLRSAIQSFIGKQLQHPPLYSAKRIRGVRMYHIARGMRQLQRPDEEPTVPGPGEKTEPALSSDVADSNSALVSLRVATGEVPIAEPTLRHQDSTATIRTEEGSRESNRPLSQGCRSSVLDATSHRRYLYLKELPQPCEVEIYDAKLVEGSNYELPFFEMEVYCSKGTYIRQLAADIAARCHTVAHVVELTRVYQAPFYLDDCVPLSGLDLATLRRRLLRADVISKLIQK